MTVSFKQFSSFLDQAEGKTSDQLDEIFGKIFGKPEDKEGKANKAMAAQTMMAARKAKEEERKKELHRKRDEAMLAAKERMQNGGKKSQYDKDDYALHRSVREGKESYSDESYWKDDAEGKGYKVKKLSGDLMHGDQTWGAFDGDKKMGEFTEKEQGRGGWLM